MRLEKLLMLGIGGLVGLMFLFGSFTTVQPGERGIMVTMGKPGETVYTEGFHFKFPFISTMQKLSTRVQKTEAGTEAASKDLQRVHVVLALNWHLDGANVINMFKSVGSEENIIERIINPAVAEVLKAAASKLTAEEILTKRIELKNNIDESLVKRLATYNVIVDDVSLVNVDFTREFNVAVEAKQIAEQEAKQALYVAQKATADAQAAINKAKGEAEATLLNATAQAKAQNLLKQTTTKELLQLKAIERWNGVMPTVMGSSGSMLFNIPAGKSRENND